MKKIPGEREELPNDNVTRIAPGQKDGPKVYPYKLMSQIAEEKESFSWIIKNLLIKESQSLWYGPPGCCKSALLGSLAIHRAALLPWFGRRNKGGAGGVVYFAAERANLVRMRLRAQLADMGLSGDLPIAVVDAEVDLSRPHSSGLAIRTIKEIQDKIGIPVDLGIFDTFAKMIAAGGGDEQQAKDKGIFYANLDDIQRETGIHSAVIGHTGKNADRGERGSNASTGSVGVEVLITREGDIGTATVTKANYIAQGPLFSFRSKMHLVGIDEDGDREEVHIIDSGAIDPQPKRASNEGGLKKNQKTLLTMLHNAGSMGLTTEAWNMQAREAGIGVGRKADLNDIRDALLSKRLIRHYNDRWHAIKDA